MKTVSAGFKQKARHEMQDYLATSAYLCFFFCAVVAYTMLLLRSFDAGSLSFVFAIANALIIAKVIMLGEIAHLGKKGESYSLYRSVLLKAVLFVLLVLVFHFIEELAKKIFHNEPAVSALRETDLHLLAGRGILIFCAFIPLFAFRELRRVLGEDELYLILRSGRRNRD